MIFKLKPISTIIIILILLSFTLPTTALEKSKLFPALLVISGVGLKFGSVYLETQANEAYDNYLHTALQADMIKFTDEYDTKHTQSLIASRVGSGFWALAVFISIYRQLHSVSPEKESENAELGMRRLTESKLYLLSSSGNMQTNISIRRPSGISEANDRNNGDALLVISRRF
ncbi:MAG: hypothetical protein ACE5PV_00260 [Candidatus Poribacteria bacterium]